MRSIKVSQFGTSDVLKIAANHPVPHPSADEVLVDVKAAGVNPVDTYIRSGTYIRKPNLPYTPGSDLAGVIAKLGRDEKDSRFKVGDRVFACGTSTGAYAEYSTVSVKDCFSLPDNLSYFQGAAIGVPAFTAYRALFVKGNGKDGESVLIHGATGAVGIMAIQLAVAHGMKVFGTAGTDEGKKLILEQGVSHAFNHNSDDIVESVMKATDGKGINLIIEMLADKNLVKDCQMAALFGRIIVVGCRGEINFSPRLTMGKELIIQGVALARSSDVEFQQQSCGVVAALKQGILKPLIDKVFPLEDAKSAHDYVIEKTSSRGKVVLNCSDEQ